jgi:hypothetical protein
VLATPLVEAQIEDQAKAHGIALLRRTLSQEPCSKS